MYSKLAHKFSIMSRFLRFLFSSEGIIRKDEKFFLHFHNFMLKEAKCPFDVLFVKVGFHLRDGDFSLRKFSFLQRCWAFVERGFITKIK